ncbi:MAG: cytochrome c [Acidobacteria bacterium]|jgi:mono/diheme cytochrome c family protein|nr:cytochrome c [Acidobacteriota bacterium]
MRRFAATGCLALAAGSLAFPARGTPQGKKSPTHLVSGSYTYRTYCATCHGPRGKGDGPLAEDLRLRPPDLAQMARNNDGKYPAELVEKIVDGRKPVDGHGGPDMPVWGDAFKNTETGFDDEKVRQRIRSVVDHVGTIQEK